MLYVHHVHQDSMCTGYFAINERVQPIHTTIIDLIKPIIIFLVFAFLSMH
jgi:hypothetical protein